MVGIPLALLGATLGATGSFLLSRYFSRDTLGDWLSERATFRAAKTAVDEEGTKILALLRLSPAVPFGLLNYLLGLTKVPLTLYIIHFDDADRHNAGDDGRHLCRRDWRRGRPNGTQVTYLVVGLVATAVVVIAITWKASSYLHEEGIRSNCPG
jgi:hypothetical protein